MKSPIRSATAGAVALALAACGQNAKDDVYLKNVPELAALTMDTASAAPTGVAGAVVDPLPVTTAGDDLALVHRKAQALNAALRAVFDHLEALAATGGTQLAGNVKQWGPATRCVEPAAGGCAAGGEASLRLLVRRYGDHAADFVVYASSTSTTIGKPALAGYLLRGGMDRRGAGKLWVNHANLHEAAPGFRGTGYLAAGFAAGPVAKRATYRMFDFTRDPAVHPAVTAAFTGFRNAAGWSRARVAGLDPKLYPSASDPGAGTELGLWRAAWAPALGGRAFTVIASGDVPAGKYWFARACYPPGQTTPSYKEWFECDRLVNGLPNAPVACLLQNAGAGVKDAAVGDPALASWQATTCHWDPARHAGAAEPDELRSPGDEPREADDDRDEDGASHAGVLPEPCPAPDSAANPDPRPPGMGGMM